MQFPEGTLTYPSKRQISSRAPEIAEANWRLLDWDTLRSELESIRQVAAELEVWCVVGAPHPLSAGRRPHNSLYVFSDRGVLVTRYDKQRLSTTEITHMYTPGDGPITFEVDGVRFGMALCLEVLFPETFIEYADDDADVVLLSSAPDPRFGVLAEAHALMNVLTVGLSFAASENARARSGICAPHGWTVSCGNGAPDVVVADVVAIDPSQRTFHRRARSGLYESRRDHRDPRSIDRATL